jgi:hypothetical protein
MRLVLLVLAAGCAVSQTQVRETNNEIPGALATAAAPEGNLICRMERPTGSHIAEEVCRFEHEMEHDRRRTQMMLLTTPHFGACKGDVCANPPPGEPRVEAGR